VVRGTVAGPFAEEPSGAETFLGTGGLPTPRVQAVVRTPSARIVVGTNAGLAAFAGGATPWLALPIHGPAVNGGSRIEANGAGVWISLGNAVPSGGEIGNALHYDGATWSRISNASSTGNLQSTGLIDILATTDGRLWLGHCCSNGIGPQRPRVDRWDPAADVWDRPAAFNLIALAQAPSGRVYGAGVEFENGVYVFDGASAALLDSLTPENTAGGLTRRNLRDVALDAAGRGWFATVDNGVDRWNGRGTDTHADDVWTHFASGFPNLQTTALVVTASGDTWVGTRGGIVRIVGDAVDAVTTFAVNVQIGGASVNDLAVDREEGVWIATAGGLTRIGATGAIERFTLADGLAASDVLALRWDDGRGVLWALTTGGVSEIHPSFSNRFPFDDRSYVYPNPATGSTSVIRLGGISGEIRGEIRDLSGTRLQRFRADPTATTIWDLRNAHGDRVASGVYLVVLRQGDLTRVLRLAVTR
jgi:ligand-binding sensor domain-containing protein